MDRNRSLMESHGLSPDALYWGSAHEMHALRITDAIQSRRLISIVGPFGFGKSVLVRTAIDGMKNLTQIWINQPDREHLRIGQVITKMIMQLSAENPKRDNMTRTSQLERLIGERVVNQRREVVVILDNAHRMHASTLLALKDLRESVTYRGRSFLFSVVLVGQEPLRAKLERYGEVFFRTKSIDLSQNGWMSCCERYSYLEAVYGEVIEARTRERLAALFTTPLELDHFIESKLEQMRNAGLAVLDETVMPLSIREQREALKVSLRELERAAKVSAATISDIERGIGDNEETKARVQQALDDLIQKRRRAA